jgi:hypothetical protein
MPNPNPTQSSELLKKRFQRVVGVDSCIPAGVPLAAKAIGVKLPGAVDEAVRALGKDKAAWLREVICKAALEQGLIDSIQ